jgi:uncharacterized protein with GYD domain
MPKMLVKVAYTAEGTKGLLKDGGSGRKAAVQKLVEGMGGKVEMFYYAYGAVDAFLVIDMPEAKNGLALTLAVNASGAVRLETVPLITPEELDAASKTPVAYRAPGS